MEQVKVPCDRLLHLRLLDASALQTHRESLPKRVMCAKGVVFSPALSQYCYIIDAP